MSFFKQFPTTTYDLKRDGNLIAIKDIFRNVDVNEKIIDPTSAYQYYYIQDGERPDQIADKLYNNSRYYWTLFMINDALKDGYDQWPLSYQQLQSQIREDYTPYLVLELGPQEIKVLEQYANPITSLSFGVRNTNNYGVNDTIGDTNRTHISIGTGHKLDAERKQLWIKADQSTNTAIAFRNYLSSGKSFGDLKGSEYSGYPSALVSIDNDGIVIAHPAIPIQFSPIGEGFRTDVDTAGTINPITKYYDRVQTVMAIDGWSAAWQAPYYYTKNGERISHYDHLLNENSNEITGFKYDSLTYNKKDGLTNDKAAYNVTDSGLLYTISWDGSKWVRDEDSGAPGSFTTVNTANSTYPWLDSTGNILPDFTSFVSLQSLGGASGTPYTYSEWLEDENQKKTAIRVVKREYITEFVEIFKQYVNS